MYITKNTRLLAIIALIFFSLTLLSAQVNHWETIIKNGDDCKYFIPTSDLGDSWKSNNYLDVWWKNGKSGIGYGDDDDETIVDEGTQCIYMRYKFNITSLENLDSLTLDIDYDDGFVAYINGEEVARANISGTISWDMDLDGLREAELPQGGKPERFILKNMMHKVLIEGDNVLAVEVHNESATSSDLSSSVFLQIGINNEDTIYQETPEWFWDPVFIPEIEITESTLPIMIINTNNSIIRDEERIVANMGLIYNGEDKTNSQHDNWNEYNGLISIEYRGESSREFDKRSFSIELQKADGSNNNTSLLGLPEENDFVLYGPYSDKSLVKNILTYELYRRTGKWAPRTRYFEMILDGEYRGIYVLTEKLKRDKNRINIDKLSPEETDPEAITGGYILRRDKLTKLDESEYWKSPVEQVYYEPLTYQYYDPKAKDLNPTQKDYIQNWMKEFDEMMSGDDFKDPDTGYDSYIKVKSFIDMMFINEISKGIDSYMFSTYFHKENDVEGGKLIAGAPWDYNLGYGNLDYGDGHNIPESHSWVYDNWSRVYWFARLMEDENYQNKVYCRWTEFRNSIYSNESIEHIIDSCVNHLGNAVDRNFEKFPVLGKYVWPNKYYPETYDEEISILKNWLFDRLAWMDSQWYNKGECDLTNNIRDNKTLASITVYPNPSNFSELKLELNTETAMQNVHIELTDLQGRLLHSHSIETLQEGKNSYKFPNMNHLSRGLYVYKVYNTAHNIAVGKVVKSE